MTTRPAPASGRQKMLVAPVEVRDRMLKAVKDSRPKFHPIQVCAQALESFDQISNDHIGRLFRHC
ncbi:MAG TPA: hypothetical protein VEK31_10285 [Xanthobacteraceae bacterium]|nr:hypothetical protein [Xanthobacteraceae bacterium]